MPHIGFCHSQVALCVTPRQVGVTQRKSYNRKKPLSIHFFILPEGQVHEYLPEKGTLFFLVDGKPLPLDNFCSASSFSNAGFIVLSGSPFYLFDCCIAIQRSVRRL